jgi:hypothetical protein
VYSRRRVLQRKVRVVKPKFRRPESTGVVDKRRDTWRVEIYSGEKSLWRNWSVKAQELNVTKGASQRSYPMVIRRMA